MVQYGRSTAFVVPSTLTKDLPVVWAFAGVAATFAEAIYRLGIRALSTVASGLTAPEWCVFAVAVIAFAFFEGHRALARRFAPRVVARSFALRSPEVALAFKLLAPLYVLTLIGAERRELVRAWVAVLLIAAAVLAVRALPHPWRGIVDGAVAVALSWGLVAMGRQFVGAWR
jgi:hypothetical protein